MRYGCFGFSHQIDLIKAAGFDSVELDFCEITDMEEDAFQSFSEKAKASGLGFEVFSGLVSLKERFHTPGFNLDYWLERTRKGARRAKELGCYMIPFGAGKCRSIPEGADPIAARRRVAEIVRAFSEVLAQEGILLVIEPLGPANSNFLNTLPEVDEFLKEVDHPNCSSMCDLRHMHKTGEPLFNLSDYHAIVKHAHIDYPRGFDRYFPAPSDDYDYLPYFRALREANYQGLLTVEATCVKKDFFKEANTCISYLHELEQKAGF